MKTLGLSGEDPVAPFPCMFALTDDINIAEDTFRRLSSLILRSYVMLLLFQCHTSICSYPSSNTIFTTLFEEKYNILYEQLFTVLLI